jgi:hypothetical protein
MSNSAKIPNARQRHRASRQHSSRNPKLKDADPDRIGFQFGRQQDPTHGPDRDEEERASGAENDLDVVANGAGGLVQCPQNGVSHHGAFDGAAGQKAEQRQPGQQFQVGA